MLDSLANVVAGLGLFFAGIWFLSENLKRATSRRFGQAVVTWTRQPAAHDRSDVARWSEYAIDGESSAVLSEMREALMSYDGDLSHEDRSQLFRINHLSERFFWLLAHVRIDEFARLDKD